MAEYTLTPTQSEEIRTVGEDTIGLCGATLQRGGTCDRPADECPYHGDEDG